MNTYDVRAEFQGGYTARRATTDLIIVHHAAALYPQLTGIGDVRAVADYHTRNRGWPGIGYHVTLAEEQQGGAIAEYLVSDPDLERAHIYGRNDAAFGVSCLTNFAGLPDPKWIEALVPVLVRAKRRYPHAAIAGHGEQALPGWGTACPGPRWQDWKPRLLAMVDEVLRQPAPADGLAFQAAPRISQAQFRQVLAREVSPVAALADELYSIVVGYHLDPAVALAFFGHESDYGTRGLCVDYGLRNWGNVRTPVRAERGVQLVLGARGNFFRFHSWQDGLRDWCERIILRYIGQGLSTVQLAVPVYAPSFDDNQPQEYIADVLARVAAWQREDGSDPTITPLPQLRRFRVTARAGAKVRQAPSRQSLQAGLLPLGREILVDVVKSGATVDGYGAERRWLHMSAENPERDLGFVFWPLCEEVR